MQRTAPRAFFVLLILLSAVAAPILLDGYSELKKAESATAYSDIALHYQRAAQRIPWRADLYELAGHAYFHATDFATADAMYQAAADRNTLSPEGWAAWGDVNFLNRNSARAVEIWKQALTQDDFLMAIYLRLAHAAQEDGKYEEAEHYLKLYLSHQADDASAQYRLGLLLTLADPNRAASELTAASQLDPEFDSAVRTLLTALNLASLTDAPAEKFLITGNGLALVEEWQLARTAFESAVQADEFNAEAWAWLGEANQHTGREGTDELNRALELNPNSSAVRGLRGLYFQRMGNYRDALTEFQAAAALEPQNPARFVSLGDAFALTGDLIRALESFQFAATLAPDDVNVWRALADFCGRYGVHIEDVGIPAAQKAVDLAGDDAVNLDTLGWLLMLKGRVIESELALQNALDLDDGNDSAHLHLGMLYLQQGESDLAFEHLSRARDLGSDQAGVLLKQYFP